MNIDADGKATPFLELVDPQLRLLAELEFIQNLSNVKYLHYLSQNRYFVDERFMNFLKYLRYWKQPEYIRLLTFPQCLIFLDALIENEEFRQELHAPMFIEFVHQQIGQLWLQGGGSSRS